MQGQSALFQLLGSECFTVNVKEFCDYLGIGQTQARELLKGQNGFGIQIGNRWYANKRKLDTWLDKETV